MHQGADIRLRYMPQLDGLRAIAVAIVIVHHAVLPDWFGGWLGIDVFFVLSGYLITSLLQVEMQKAGRIHLLKFYLRRLLRLYPPLLFAVLVLLPVGFLLWPSLTRYAASSALAVTYLTNLATVALGSATGPWTHTWTLAMEEQFYLVWPLVLIAAAALRLRGRLFVAIISVIAAGSLVFGAAMYEPASVSSYNPVLHFGPLLIGCALAMTHFWRRVASSPWVGVTGLLVLAASIAGGSIESVAGLYEIPTTIGSLMAIAHLVTAPDSVLSRAFSIRPAVWVGQVSYELYLWHYPLLVVLGTVITGRLPLALIAVGASLLMAAISRRYISRPITRALKPRLEWVDDKNARPHKGAGRRVTAR